MRTIFAISLLLVAGVAQGADAVTELGRFYDRLRDLETRFEQTQYDENGKVIQVSLGHFSLARPDRFRWEYTTPYTQTMVSDGRTFWLYDVDLAQVTRRRAADALQGTPALLLAGGPALNEQFSLQAEGEQDGLLWVRMVPQAEGGDFSNVRLGLKGGVPHAMTLRDNLGQITHIQFSDVRLNPGIRPDYFEFTVPKGVEVVDADAALPRSSR